LEGARGGQSEQGGEAAGDAEGVPGTGSKREVHWFVCLPLPSLSPSFNSPSFPPSVLKTAAFVQPSIFSDVNQDDLLRLCPSLHSLDSPYASFAPLSDGRRPLAAYPATLCSIRLGVPFASLNAVEYDSEGAMQPVGCVPNYLKLLDDLPEGITSLKFSQLFDTTLPSVPPLTAMPLKRLTSLSLDFVTVSPLLLDWLAPSTAAVPLEKVQIWCVEGLSGDDIVRFVQRVGGGLKEFMFKPKGSKQGTKLGNELVGCVLLLLSLPQGILTRLFLPQSPSQPHLPYSRRQSLRPRDLLSPPLRPSETRRLPP
jgi:hypothetical protein